MASDMRKVLIIGAGGIGRRHIKGYLETGRATLSVVEPDEAKRAAIASEFALAAAYSDLESANLTAFDLAVICTPANHHVPIMEACATAKLPFLVEKPLAVSLNGVDAAITLVERAGILARVGYIRRIAPEVRQLRSQIADGKIGTLKLAYLNSSQEFPKYRPDYRSTYYSRPEMGGGAILDAASHSFDMLISIMGEPVTVGAMYDRLALEGSETEDTCLISILFANGTMANLTINQFQKRNVARAEFIGTAGNLKLDHATLNFTDDDSGHWSESRDFMEGMVPMQAHQARFTIQANTMLDALDGKPDPLATLQEARTNLALALAAKRSWIEKRFIDLAEVS
ncbi:Gfo/Idh/MocA family protein [Flavimaricola marinus]|uniref:1,5-anhydro-D-fructose reductase n=1 Tax=Flavimaricola marinus TaxID=1819565 RepID=A0A238LGY7_9RHOB|nr:Gfo/Idh/MocA family oxidoreductase [Flavimaricola marinus]SMY08888.1 1,5-anhydro-D-fructose reductase [Flavimaricola marinus]